VEFRVFAGTLNAKKILHHLGTVLGLCRRAHEVRVLGGFTKNRAQIKRTATAVSALRYLHDYLGWSGSKRPFALGLFGALENQGVEIGGFALWNVADPARAIESVDFTDPVAGLDRLGEQLRAVLEASIRREVANLTLEQVLRQRAAMTHLLGDELAGIAQRWGLAVAAVEIRSVQVLSKQLFENLQAKFRDAQRLESARSAMETDEAIARARAADREAAATRDLAFRLAETARDEEARRQEIARDQRLEEAKETARREREIARLDSELALVRAREERLSAALGANEALLGIEEIL
jgi:hypothetical protein